MGGGRKKEEEEHVELHERKEGETEVYSCVIMVGSTGAGKSSTVNIMAHGKDHDWDKGEAVGEGVLPTTQKLATVKQKGRHFLWIDNPGWNDPDMSDEETFKSIFKDLTHKENKTPHHVKAVVWCINGAAKLDGTMRKQAELINFFLNDKIWANVIIIHRGGDQPTVEARCQGALAAAKKACPGVGDFKGRLLSYTFATPEDLTETFKSDEVRRKKLFLADEEIRAKIQDVIDSLPDPVKVVSADEWCSACGQSGDRRLFGDRCHALQKQGHLGEEKGVYSFKQAGGMAASAVGLAGVAALGAVGGEVIAACVCGAVALPLLWPATTKLFCGCGPCGKTPSSSKPILGVILPKKRWSKCKHKVDKPPCEDICKECKGIWGEPNGCVTTGETTGVVEQRLKEESGGWKNHVIKGVEEKEIHDMKMKETKKKREFFFNCIKSA